MNDYRISYILKPMRGCVIIKVPCSDKIALSAAWGLIAAWRLHETYRIKGDCVVFRLRDRTYTEWLDIIRSVCSEGEDLG